MSINLKRSGLFAREVATVVGLPIAEVYELHGATMGSPGHFIYREEVGEGLFYLRRGLLGLVDALENLGRIEQAERLREVVK